MKKSIENKKLIVLTGMHRSGTTFLGEVISKSTAVSVLHEPFNRIYGISEIQYDYVDSSSEQRLILEKYIFKLLNRRLISFSRSVNADDWMIG